MAPFEVINQLLVVIIVYTLIYISYPITSTVIPSSHSQPQSPHVATNKHSNTNLNNKSSEILRHESKIDSFSLPLSKAFNFNSKSTDNCENIPLQGPRGSISSPGYPLFYKTQSSCMWSITVPNDHVITISFDDLDLEVLDPHVPPNSHQCFDAHRDQSPIGSNDNEPCCAHNWVKLGPSPNGIEQRFCGRSEDNNLILKSFSSDSNEVWIKFHTGPTKKEGGRGFHLSYIVGPKKVTNRCKEDEFKCANGKCILASWRCNRRHECQDGSDELACDDICLAANEVKCGLTSHNIVPGCYSFPKQRCDSNWDCENGADEKGCGGCPANMFMCHHGSSCYGESKRCDGHADCVDYSDEINCGFCQHNKVLCGGTTSLTQCYDPIKQKCNRVLDCPNGEDEKGCTSIHGCHNKILCASGSDCYSSEERCNGIHECNDYSDETNCTIDYCRIERGSFLCANGRCIKSVWLCDRSNDCGDSSDEVNCLKNSVITAAIMGSLICGLLLVIAISCTCKLIALRQVEHHQLHNQSSPSHISHHYDRSLGVSSHDSETSLFRLEHGVFFREPPPSYAAAVGNGNPGDRNSSNTYIEQIRQIRRQRRLSRRNRRRPTTPPPAFTDEDNRESGSVSSNLNSPNISGTSCDATNTATTTSSHVRDRGSESDNKEDNLKDGDTNSNSNQSISVTSPISSTASTTVHIELDNINISIPSFSLPTSQDDCDSQPLIS